MKLVAGRSCQGCTLCCKLLAIEALDKPRAVWCGHCDVRRGCKIHGQHPDECRDFFCAYRTNPELDERWNPSKCKIVLAYEEQHAPRLSLHVDPGRPNAWREEPFYGLIKRWAHAAAAAKGQVIVWHGPTVTAVLPDGEKELGEVRPDQFIVTSEKMGPGGPTLDVIVVDADDPIAQSIRSRKTAG